MDYVLNELSYQNLLLLSASIPSFKSSRDKEGKPAQEECIDGDDPANRELINKLFDESR